jgi:hypothetical protein
VVPSTQFTLLTECCLPDVEKYVNLFSSVQVPLLGTLGIIFYISEVFVLLNLCRIDLLS